MGLFFHWKNASTCSIMNAQWMGAVFTSQDSNGYLWIIAIYPLVSKLCSSRFHQIQKQSHPHPWWVRWVHLQLIFIFGWTISLKIFPLFPRKKDLVHSTYIDLIFCPMFGNRYACNLPSVRTIPIRSSISILVLDVNHGWTFFWHPWLQWSFNSS